MAQYTVTTVAGGEVQSTPVPAVQATLGAANGFAVDGAGNLYFSVAAQNSVFKIDKSGTLTTVTASEGPVRLGFRAAPGAGDLDSPRGLAVDASGDLYIAESGANRVRKVSANGAVSIVAGSAGAGYSGDGGPAVHAQLSQPTGLALDAAGNLYIADSGNYRIRKVSLNGIISTAAGTGVAGPFSNGAATSSNIGFVDSIAADSKGNLYIADRMAGAVLRVSPRGTLAAVAGQESFGYSGDGGPATAALLNSPSGVAVNGAGSLYIADSGNNVIREVSPSGIISTAAGSGQPGYSGDGGAATSAALTVWGISVDGAGNLYLYGGDSHIRQIGPGGGITTIAGGGLPAGSASATQTTLQFPQGLVIDSSGGLYIADAGDNVIRRLAPDGTFATVAGNGSPGYAGDGGPATSAQLNNPDGLAVDAKGNLYIADSGNNVVRKVTPAGTITTFAGGGTGPCSYVGSATGAQLVSPAGLAVDSSGNLYIADSGNNCIRKVLAASGAILNVAGGSTTGDFYLSDQSTALGTDLYFPQGIAVDGAGNLYIADTGNSCVRKVTPAGAVSILAGNGIFGYSGDGGPASSASLGAPWAVAVDNSGSVYIADTANQRVRQVSPDGAIATIAGTGTPGYTGDGLGATCAELSNPWSVAAGPSGVIYVSDWGNGVVRALAPEGPAPATESGRLGRPIGVAASCGTLLPMPRPLMSWTSDLPLSQAELAMTSAPDPGSASSGSPPAPGFAHTLRTPHPASALAGGVYTPGPDLDFSYVPLLQPSLPFVQLIQRYLNLASSLTSMAETMRGADGSSLLAKRSQVLEYVAGGAPSNAWWWMMTNPQANIPLTMNYTTPLGHAIPFYDTFSQSAAAQVFTPADLTALTQYLDIVPPELLQYIQFIVNGPVFQMFATYSSYTEGWEISIEAVGEVYNAQLLHEIGWTLVNAMGNGLYAAPLFTQWGGLWSQSAANPAWDTVNMNSSYPPRPMPANEPMPFGFIDEGEDFCSVLSDWGGDSGTPRVNPSKSSSIIEEAVYRAQQGYTILLQKTLLVASLFTDPSTLQLSRYYYAGYLSPFQAFSMAQPIQRTLSAVLVSPTSLTVGDYTFTIQSGLLTGVTSPASQATVASGQVVSIPALNYTFPTPVPIPAFAASRWGMH
jgi:sugar lactone lactonase YvrE